MSFLTQKFDFKWLLHPNTLRITKFKGEKTKAQWVGVKYRAHGLAQPKVDATSPAQWEPTSLNPAPKFSKSSIEVLASLPTTIKIDASSIDSGEQNDDLISDLGRDSGYDRDSLKEEDSLLQMVRVDLASTTPGLCRGPFLPFPSLESNVVPREPAQSVISVQPRVIRDQIDDSKRDGGCRGDRGG